MPLKTEDVIRSPLGREQLVALAKEAGFEGFEYAEKNFEKFAAFVRAERDKDYLQLESDFAGKFDATKDNVFIAIKAIATRVYEL